MTPSWSRPRSRVPSRPPSPPPAIPGLRVGRAGVVGGAWSPGPSNEVRRCCTQSWGGGQCLYSFPPQPSGVGDRTPDYRERGGRQVVASHCLGLSLPSCSHSAVLDAGQRLVSQHRVLSISWGSVRESFPKAQGLLLLFALCSVSHLKMKKGCTINKKLIVPVWSPTALVSRTLLCNCGGFVLLGFRWELGHLLPCVAAAMPVTQKRPVRLAGGSSPLPTPCWSRGRGVGEGGACERLTRKMEEWSRGGGTVCDV